MLKRITVIAFMGVAVFTVHSVSPALAAKKVSTAKLVKLIKRQGKQIRKLKKGLKAVKKGVGAQGGTGPAGPQGPQGSQGHQGTLGQQGEPGAQKLVKTGNKGVLPISALGLKIVTGKKGIGDYVISDCPPNSWAIGANISAVSTGYYRLFMSQRLSADGIKPDRWQVSTSGETVQAEAICLQYSQTG